MFRSCFSTALLVMLIRNLQETKDYLLNSRYRSSIIEGIQTEIATICPKDQVVDTRDRLTNILHSPK